MNILSTNLGSTITVEKLEALKGHKIFTSLDFVQCNNDKLATIVGQHVSEIIKIKDSILQLNNSRPVRADRLCDLRLQNTCIIESGIKCIDDLLGGGLHCGSLTEVFGYSGSGKTQLAYKFSANAAIKYKYRVMYLASGAVEVKPLHEIMHKMTQGENLSSSLKRIHFSYVSNVYNLTKLLWSPDTASCKLVIIDSLATIFMPIMGDTYNDAIALLNKTASDLKRLAVVHRCAILVLNHVSNHSHKPVVDGISLPTPTLGRFWATVPNLRLHIQHLEASQFMLSSTRNVYCPNKSMKCCFDIGSGEEITLNPSNNQTASDDLSTS